MESIQAFTSVTPFTETRVFRLGIAQCSPFAKQKAKSRVRHFSQHNTQRAKRSLHLVSLPGHIDDTQKAHTYEKRLTSLMPKISKRVLLCGRTSRSIPIMRKDIFEDSRKGKAHLAEMSRKVEDRIGPRVRPRFDAPRHFPMILRPDTLGCIIEADLPADPLLGETARCRATSTTLASYRDSPLIDWGTSNQHPPRGRLTTAPAAANTRG